MIFKSNFPIDIELYNSEFDEIRSVFVVTHIELDDEHARYVLYQFEFKVGYVPACYEFDEFNHRFIEV